MTWIFLIIYFIYFLLMIVLIVGWRKTISKETPRNLVTQFSVSVIVPVRNEYKTIQSLLNDLSHQSYRNLEVIVVNDHSEDKTEEIVIPFTLMDPRFRLLQNNGHGKKSALTYGIHASAGEIVLTTDGDCSVGKDWVLSMLQEFQNRQTQFVFGGVKLWQDSFFSSLQAMEFVSLVGAAAASASNGMPIMCNGANLAFRKTAFFEVDGYSGNFHIPSGDDEFLMRKIFSKFPFGVSFSANRNSIVTTKAAKTATDFLHQRIRWAGKWRVNQSFISRLVAIFIFCFQGSVLFLPLAAIVGWLAPNLVAMLLLLKAFIEALFLTKVARFLNVRWSWLIFLILQVAYPVYVVTIGLISNVASFEWKGRKLNSFTISPLKK
jgi:poly-beta-1,6-N-acetyl-D-glucosamine synthase